MAEPAARRERDEAAQAPADPAPALAPVLGTPEAILALQRTAGNAAVARTLARDPAQPFQLTPPSLLGGPQQRPGVSLGDFRLRPPGAPDPLMLRLLDTELRPEGIRSLFRLLPLPAAPPAAPDPFAGPPAPAPRGPGDRPPERFDISPTRPGEAGDVLAALAALPEVERLSAAAREQLWGRLPTEGKWALAVSGIVIGGAGLTGALATPSGRQQLLDLFGGRPISIPGVPWFQPEFSVQGPNYVIGLHIDIGAFLDGRGGFGRAEEGPQPLTPPTP